MIEAPNSEFCTRDVGIQIQSRIKSHFLNMTLTNPSASSHKGSVASFSDIRCKCFLACLLLEYFATSFYCWGFPLVSGSRINDHRQRFRPRTNRFTSTTSNDLSMDAAGKSAAIKIRGEGLYGAENNSTILSADQAAAAVGVEPLAKLPPMVWKYAIRLHAWLIPLLHWNDQYRPPDSQKSLMCLWWKALIAFDLSTASWQSSPIPNDNQHQLAYQLLPRSSRWILKIAHRVFPRLHHANVEIRTVFLNRAIANIVQEQRRRDETNKDFKTKRKIRLIYLGAGYDVRSIYLQQHGLIDQAIELDLPNVIEAKRKLFTAPRFRTYCPPEQLPSFFPVDLNDLDQVRTILEGILAIESCEWYNVLLFEGVMIYLQPGVPHDLLKVCSDALRATNGDAEGMLCFADRLENIPGGDEQLARQEMEATGWELVEWLPKPGLARHMGVARLKG